MNAPLMDTPVATAVEERYRRMIEAQFPDLGPFDIEEIATQMDEPEHDLDIEQLQHAIALHCHQGHSLDVALEMAWQERMVTAHAPPGYLLARVRLTDSPQRRLRLCFRHRS